MRKEYLACEETAVVAGVRIIPVVRVSILSMEIKGTRSFYACKQPVYLIVSLTDGERAYSVTGQEVSLSQVREECPALAVALGG
jgi:hypothetical protein